MSKTIREIIDGVLEDLAFMQPIELADIREVHRRIQHELSKYESPPRTRVEVYHRIRDVVITAREPGLHDPIYHRVLEAK